MLGREAVRSIGNGGRSGTKRGFEEVGCAVISADSVGRDRRERAALALSASVERDDRTTLTQSYPHSLI